MDSHAELDQERIYNFYTYDDRSVESMILQAVDADYIPRKCSLRRPCIHG